ncbi:MAG: hypothetical protein Q9211_000559 [Gyalolechia sp. 1 TL-2023]
MTHNLSQCRLLVSKAVAAGANALFLPEASDYIAPSAAETVSLAQPTSSSPFVRGLQSSAREHKLPISVGIHEPARDGKKVKNVLVWIDEDGEINERYQKLHLFDVDMPGGPVLKESKSVEEGMEIRPPLKTAVGNVGMLICFDVYAYLSFPLELHARCGAASDSRLLYSFAFPNPRFLCAAKALISSLTHPPSQCPRVSRIGLPCFALAR